MNKSLLSAAILTAVTAVMTMGCSESGPKPLESRFETYGKSHTYILQGLKSDLGGEDNDMSECDSVSLILPVMLNNSDTKDLCDTILSRALSVKGLDPFDAIDKWLAATAAESGLQTVDTVLRSEITDGFQIIQGKIVNMTSDLLTYCISNSVMLPGAANGLYTLDYINYSLTEKRVITLSELFTPDGLKKLPAVIADQAENDSRLAGNVDIESLPESDNFYLSSEGEIVFSYKPMEVGPHSLGNVQVAFLPEELVPYMTPAAIRAFGLSDLAE